MTTVEIYTKPTCPYCHRAKILLDNMGVAYTEYDVSEDPTRREEMIARTDGYTVPQILINDQAIGGSDDLVEHIENGVLLKLLDRLHRQQNFHREMNHAA